MSPFPKDPFFDYYSHLKNLPDHVLRDIARNDSAGQDYRKHAVEVLMNRKYPVFNHPEMRQFAMEIEAELDGIEFEHPDPSVVNVPSLPTEPVLLSGPLVASVTTKTMFSDDPVPETDTVDPEPASEFIKPRPTEDQMDALIELVKEEVLVPTPATDPVPPKPKRTRKPKDPVDAPSE